MKKHMKRILAALMAAAMMIMATACAGDNAGSSDAGNDKPGSSDAGNDGGDIDYGSESDHFHRPLLFFLSIISK